MKKLLRKTILFILKRLAKRRMKKFTGKVVAITGSVGKTSTKEAVFAVLNSQFKVSRSQKSMNSEFGLILTILGIESGYSSAYKWTILLFKAFYNSFLKDHSEVLILEYGVDKKGDMDFLLSIARPDIAVLTNVFPVHMNEDQFKTLDDIYNEKKKLVDGLKDHGVAILNIDNEYCAELAKKRGKKSTITYGKAENADFRATSVQIGRDGLNFILHYDDKKQSVSTGTLGEYHVYVFLPAVICGVLLGMPMENIVFSLTKYASPPGRLNLIQGVNDSVILDSSYNSSPAPLKEALKVLKEIGGNDRKIAVLGSMNELGEYSHALHREIGKLIPKYADLLITVGEDAKVFGTEALAHGFEITQVLSFDSPNDAGEAFKEKIKPGDIFLVKGSQNKVRLEKFIKIIMANPQDAQKLLVRQETVWEDIF